MRRMLRIFLLLRWMGLGLSTVLFVGTVVLWVRSVGHHETWALSEFTPFPDSSHEILRGGGILQVRRIETMHGQLWLGSGSEAFDSTCDSGTLHVRRPITADQANEKFETMFQPGQRPWRDGVESAWRFSGAGFWHGARPADPRIGQPPSKGYLLAMPFWLLAVVFGLWPVCFAARRVFRRRRYGAGLCQECGYDLRATPDRCPECGRPSRQRAAGPS